VQGDLAAVDRLGQARPVGPDHAFRQAVRTPADIAFDRHRHAIDRLEAAGGSDLAARRRCRSERDEVSVEHDVLFPCAVRAKTPI